MSLHFGSLFFVLLSIVIFCFFFFKQKTAYEMRISDWSSDVCSSDLIRDTFARDGLDQPTLSVMSFGYARGVPRNADLVFDMRFLRNPHWVDALRPGTGLDADVSAYIADDPAYADARSEEHTSELQSLMRISYAVFCLKKKQKP